MLRFRPRLHRSALLLPLLVACSDDDPPAAPAPDAPDAPAAPAAVKQVAVGDAAPATGIEDAAPAASAEEGPAESEDAVLLREVEIPDPARDDSPAYRLLVPEEWEVEGGVTAVAPAFHMIPTISDVTVRAPDGRGVRFWSMLEYGWAEGVDLPFSSPYEGRPFVPIPESLGEHWRRMFEAFPAEGVTELEVVSEEVLPAATERVREQLAPLFASTRREDAELRATNSGTKDFDADARRLVIRYTEDGRRIEATIFGSLRKSIYRTPWGSVRAAMWNLDHMYGVFGPVESDVLADPLLAAIVRSRRAVPQWQQAIQRWYLEKNQQIVAEGRAKIAAAARAAAGARTSESQDVLDISFQGWKSRNAANDAGHASSVNAIHERTTYAKPSGGTVDLPSHYRNVYTDGLGHYVLHDDANWEINADPEWNDRDWQRIDPVR